MFKHGQKVEVQGFNWNGEDTWEPAKVCRPRPENLPLPGDGWHIIQYEDGGKMCIHESRLRAA